MEKNIAIVSAPAGFGKTTLVTSWINQLSQPIAWLSLDDQDNQFQRFIFYFIKSIQQIDPSFGHAILESIYAPTPPSREVITANIIQEFDSVTKDFILVIDDFHLINNYEIHQFFQSCLQYLLTNSSYQKTTLHIVLITRVDPPYPLSRWRLNQYLAEIRIDDLRFTLRETEVFFDQVNINGLNIEQINLLGKRTEGWIAGLQLATISLKNKNSTQNDEFINTFAGDNRYVADYLFEEVFQQQSVNIKDFLLRTAVLKNLNTSLCDYTLDIQGSQALLEELEHNNLFIIPMDENRKWFRYHQLFSDLLLYRLHQTDPEVILALHARAAQWYSDQNLFEEAFFHWIEAKQMQPAMELLIRIAPQLLMDSEFHLLLNLIEKFPSSCIKVFPWLWIYRAWVYFVLKPVEVETCLEKAENVISDPFNHINQDDINEMTGNILTIRAICAARRGDIQTTFSIAPTALGLLSKTNYKVRGLALYAIGTAQSIHGENLTQAQNTLSEAGATLLQGGNFAGYVDSLSLLGDIRQMQGQLRNAQEAYKTALTISNQKEGRIFHNAVMSYNGLGRIFFEFNQTDSAIQYLEKGCELSRFWGFSQRVNCFVNLALAWLELGDQNKAEEIILQCEDWSPENILLPPTHSHLIAYQLRLHLIQNDISSINNIIEDNHLTEFDSFETSREIEWMVYLEVLFKLGKYENAKRLANQLIEKTKSGERWEHWLQVIIIQTMIYFKENQIDETYTNISEWLPIAQKENYLHSITRYGNDILDCLASYRQYNPNKPEGAIGYLDKLIGSIMENSARPGRDNRQNAGKTEKVSLGEIISDQEKKVLRLMANGLTNQEIAENLCVSVNTIKTHTARIYDKLGVHNRTQAAHRAKILKIT